MYCFCKNAFKMKFLQHHLLFVHAFEYIHTRYYHFFWHNTDAKSEKLSVFFIIITKIDKKYNLEKPHCLPLRLNSTFFEKNLIEEKWGTILCAYRGLGGRKKKKIIKN